MVLSLLEFIRGGASLEDLRVYIESTLGQDVPYPFPRAGRSTNFRTRQTQIGTSRNSLEIHRLIDQPLFKVTASPWTQVTSDDVFVSHLISLWFTWHQPLFHWVNCQLFIRDMLSKNINSSYCSPFLVNAILANACVSSPDRRRKTFSKYRKQPYSDYPEACSIPGVLSSRGDHFYEEARYLYDREEGRLSLTTLQGLAILSNQLVDPRVS